MRRVQHMVKAQITPLGRCPPGLECSMMTYFVYRDRAMNYRWQLLAANGKIIADSGEGYVAKDDCIHGINLVAGSTGTPIRDR